MSKALWSLQVLLALLFLFAGGSKLAMPIDSLTALVPLPGLFLQFVGVAEVLGSLGLIVPGLLRIRPSLTPLAALELAHVMLGATVITLAIGEGLLAALLPLVLGLLAAFVAYGRWRLAPQSAAQRSPRRAAWPAASYISPPPA